MHLSVPPEGHFRAIASELAVRIAEHLGGEAPESGAVGDQVEALASRLAGAGTPGRPITFEFRQEQGALVIEGRCGGEISELRHPLPD